MALKLMDHILCRTPVFSRYAALNENWVGLKQLIREASPSLYEIVADSDYDDAVCTTGKVWFSLWKYFNRAKFRPAPFGGFAAITLLDQFAGDLPLTLDSKLIPHELIDWQEKDAILFPSAPAMFQANSSIYTVGNEIRYIRFKDDQFEIYSVEALPELEAVVDCCRIKANRRDIEETLARFGRPASVTNLLILQLVDLQLLFPETHPNITGTDYFERINTKWISGFRKYTITERRRISGQLDLHPLKHLPDLVYLLANELPEETNTALAGFSQAFVKKFDQNAIPLALALDPETGIDYGGFADHAENDVLATFTFGNEQEKQQEPWPFTALHKFLLKRLAGGQTIRLEEFSGTAKRGKLLLPNSLNILLHFSGCNAVIENAGGCSANMLLGRFTMGSESIENACLKVASLEQEANPHVLFFDVAYQAEKRVDNVNRRKHLYAAELPILSWSAHSSPIHFDDILVMVRNNEVVLWSKKLNKRIIPRIASAYNYTRSDLAVYRFLCDLQHQNIRSDLNFDLARFFPEMSHYPRVVYKDIIVSPARWLIPAAITDRSRSASKEELANWLQNEDIDFLFRAGHADQTLVFDPKSDADMDAFLLFLKQYSKQAVYISEALVESDDLVQDENGHAFISQFIVPYCHSDAIYRSYDFSFEQLCKPFVNRRFPGSEWLYFEIYCHPMRSDQLLLGKILTLIKVSKSKVNKWFFIRYADPHPHIRLRLQLKDPGLAHSLTTELNTLLAFECAAGLVSDIQIKTYMRETERYGAGRIDLAEHFFFLDSKLALATLGRAKTHLRRYNMVLANMDRLTALFLPDINERIDFVRAIASNFTSELDISQENFKVLNQNFKSLDLPQKGGYTLLKPKYSRYEKVFLKLISQCKHQTERNNMAADLIHMHINRNFHSAQRLHEATLFHYLLKMLTTRRALSAYQAE